MLKLVNAKSWSDFGWRLLLLMLGLFLYGLSVVIILKAGLGLGSWDVFHKGLSLHTPLTFGQAGQVTGLAIILVSLFLGIKPGFGTLANMFFIGFWIDQINNSGLVPEAASLGGLPAQLLWVALGLFVVGMGSGLYIKAGLGAGPRDSFMLALVKRTGWRVAICRGIIEVTVCFVGWLLGGTVGVATLIVAFGIGPAVELGFKICRVKVNRPAKVSAAVPNPAEASSI